MVITSKVVARWPIQRVMIGAGALIDYLRTVKLLYKKETSAIPFSFIRWRAIKGEQGRLAQPGHLTSGRGMVAVSVARL